MECHKGFERCSSEKPLLTGRYSHQWQASTTQLGAQECPGPKFGTERRGTCLDSPAFSSLRWKSPRRFFCGRKNTYNIYIYTYRVYIHICIYTHRVYIYIYKYILNIRKKKKPGWYNQKEGFPKQQREPRMVGKGNPPTDQKECQRCW